MMDKTMRRACLSALVVLLGLALVWMTGCNGSGAVPDPPRKPAAGNPPAGNKADSKAPPPAQAKVPDNIYPELPVPLLNPKERDTLVAVTKAQLCPCPKAADSMHACLQKLETQCPLATSAALVAMQKIKEGYSERDVLDNVGAFVEAAYKKYSFDLSDTAHMGDPKAPVVIVEFADFECPFCNMARGIVKEVQRVHGEKVVVYFKQFPLASHPQAFNASLAVLAAQKQGKFWPMYDLVFDNQRALSDDKIKSLAQTLGLNMEQFMKDWRDPEMAKRVEREKKEGMDANVDATPTFFINGYKYLGEKTPEGLTKAVADALKKAEQK